MELETPYYRLHLKAELARRCQSNPRYSLRAFARSLTIDPSSLSKILSGKMPLSPKAAVVAVERLGCTPEQEQLFLNSLGEEIKRQRLGPRAKSERERETEIRELEEEQFRNIADWYHMAILSLTELESNQRPGRFNPRAIAVALGITVTEASLAIERLQRLGLLVEKDGCWKQTAPDTSTRSRPFTNGALRRRQRQVLEKAIHSLENDPIEERSMTCMTMAIDPDKLEMARQIISEMNRHLDQVLSSGKQSRVYHLSIALYPVQKKEAP